MSPNHEKRLLLSVLQPTAGPPPRPSFLKRDALPFAHSIVVAVAFLILFRFIDTIGIFAVLLIAACFGFAAGLLFHRNVVTQASSAQWLVIRPHISSDSVLERLSELEQKQS